MLEYGIDIDEFNRITAQIMYELLDEWCKKLKLIKLNMEKNKEFFEHTNHYLMLSDMIEKNKEVPAPKEFFYKADDEDEVREQAIATFAKNSSFPAFLRKICTDMLGNLVAKFDKDGDRDKGFNNFIHTFFLNKKLYDYVYDNSEEFKSFADSINNVEVLDKFYAARDDKAFQEKLNEPMKNMDLQVVVKDPLFCDTCTVMEGAGMFRDRVIKTKN